MRSNHQTMKQERGRGDHQKQWHQHHEARHQPPKHISARLDWSRLPETLHPAFKIPRFDINTDENDDHHYENAGKRHKHFVPEGAGLINVVEDLPPTGNSQLHAHKYRNQHCRARGRAGRTSPQVFQRIGNRQGLVRTGIRTRLDKFQRGKRLVLAPVAWAATETSMPPAPAMQLAPIPVPRTESGASIPSLLRACGYRAPWCR